MKKKSSNLYTSSCEIIYSMISSRIKTRKNDLKLTNREICPNAEQSLISAIVNNRRDEKKNKYLIPDGVKGTYISENIIPFVDTIASNLKYSSTTEMLTGTLQELEAYSGYLFAQLIKDALSSESELDIEKINDLLSDYLPYAKSSTYLNIVEKYGDVSEYTIDKSFQVDISECSILMEEAIARLFYYYKDEFQLLFINFFSEQPNTLKLNSRLSEFVISKLIPSLISCRRKNSLINDAKIRLYEHHEKIVCYLNYELSLSPETIGYHENETSYYERNIIFDWILAEEKYINALESIQQKSEPAPDITLLFNTWNENMCKFTS